MRRQFKFGTKPLEKKMNQAKNVKKLTTSDDAYSPEKMYVVSSSKSKKGSMSSRPRVQEKTDLTARGPADKLKSEGLRAKSYYRKDLPEGALREVFRKEARKNRKPVAGGKSKNSMKKPPPKLKKRRKII
jgi:hypothetical protein